MCASSYAQRRKLDAEAAARAAARGRPGSGGTAGDAGAIVGGSKGGAKGQVGALFRQQQAAVTAVPWQLLQLADTTVPGRFKVGKGRSALRKMTKECWQLGRIFFSKVQAMKRILAGVCAYRKHLYGWVWVWVWVRTAHASHKQLQVGVGMELVLGVQATPESTCCGLIMLVAANIPWAGLPPTLCNGLGMLVAAYIPGAVLQPTLCFCFVCPNVCRQWPHDAGGLHTWGRATACAQQNPARRQEACPPI
eukprot:scaffold18176_cov20-Tisochrysis_lutea.AAC.4